MATFRFAPIVALLLLGVLMLQSSQLNASPSDFQFRNVANTSSGQYQSLTNPALESDGSVLFNGTLRNGVTGVFYGADPETDFIARGDGLLGPGEIGRPVVNGHGALVWITHFGAIVGDGDGTDVVLEAGVLASVKNVVINNTGESAFWGLRQDGTQGIFRPGSRALSAEPIADSTDYPYFNDAVGPRTSARNFAFIAGTKDFKSGIFTGPDPVKDVIVDSSGLIGGFRNFDINDHARIIASVQLDDETPALLIGRDPIANRLPLDGFGFAGDHLAINNDAKFVFDGETRDGRAGLFTGANPVNDRILVVGDSLFGSTVTQLSFDTPGFNESAQVAFTYSLANGSAGIAVATPFTGNAVPLPAALPATLVLVGAFALRSTVRAAAGSMRACLPNKPMTR